MALTGAGSATLKASGFILFGNNSSLTTASGAIDIEARVNVTLDSGANLTVEGKDYSHAGKGGSISLEAGSESNGQIGRITTGGAVTEYIVPTPGSEPRGITAGPDGRVWFVEAHGNKVGALRPSARSPSQSPRPPSRRPRPHRPRLLRSASPSGRSTER